MSLEIPKGAATHTVETTVTAVLGEGRQVLYHLDGHDQPVHACRLQLIRRAQSETGSP